MGEDYKQWAATAKPPCLWISGDAGTGKTMLLSAIVDDLTPRGLEGDVTAYCFLEEGLGKDSFACHLLEVLICELHNHRAVPGYLHCRLLPEIKVIDYPISKDLFKRILRRLLENVHDTFRVVLVLDTVSQDEWVNMVIVDEVIRANRVRSREFAIRCAISSRASYGRNIHRDQITNISLNNEPGVQDDVLRFAEWRLASICETSATSSLASLAKALCYKGQGVFLWVRLVIESLDSSSSIVEWHREIRTLPRTLNGLYHLTIKNILSQQIDDIQTLLHWLIAARRPMKLSELLEAMVVETRPRSPAGVEEMATQIWQMQCPEIEIPKLCKPLIIIKDNAIVEFRHHSIREFLSSCGGVDVPRSWSIEAHETVAQTCLTLLTAKERGICALAATSYSCPARSTLIDYASMHWAFHYGLVEPHSKTIAGTLHRTLMVILRSDCQQFSLPRSAQDSRIAMATLRIAAHNGFTSLTRASLQMGVNPNGEHCGSCPSPLALAAAGGHAEAVALLLHRGASVNASHRFDDESALHLAVACGSYRVSMMLLNAGADANVTGGDLRKTPLHVAASSGYLDIVKLLADHKADPNAAVPESEETALHLAAHGGHLRVVRWLLEEITPSSAEIDFCESIVHKHYYQNWLSAEINNSDIDQPACWGSENGRCACRDWMDLRTLCGRYTDINSRNAKGQTALCIAASSGHTKLVQFLLSKGADKEIGDHEHHTSLEMAATTGQLSAVMLLLEGNKDVSVSSARFGEILKTVYQNGHHAIANLLAWHRFIVKGLNQLPQWRIMVLASKSEFQTVRVAFQHGSPDRHSRSPCLTKFEESPP